MNKELYLKREKYLKELQDLSFLLYSLHTFLVKNEKNFKREESIEALKKIKAYFEIKEKEYKVIENKQKEIDKELYTTCSHEVAIKRSYRPTYQCLICNHHLRRNQDGILEQALISIDTTTDYQVESIIEEIFLDIVNSDKNLIETISTAVEEIQYERDIKVYRRSK